MPKDMFKEALKAAFTERMEIEVTGPCNAADGERTVARTGDRARVLETRVGTIQLALPRVRQGPSSIGEAAAGPRLQPAGR
jgi:transposase-like protein